MSWLGRKHHCGGTSTASGSAQKAHAPKPMSRSGDVASDRVSTTASLLRPALAGVMASAFLLSGCVASPYENENRASFLENPPKMGWDRNQSGTQWTIEAFQAVAEKDAALATRVPADIEAWCPGYKTASLEDRRAFWVGLMSAVSKHESTWNAKASGGGGRYIGLMQISPRTAQHHGCDAKTASALKDGGENLTCAVEIFAEQVASDGVVAGSGRKGIGRDWGPFRKSGKRAEMAAWTSKQSYCQG